MSTTELLTFIWLVLLTITQLVQLIGAVQFRKQMAPLMREVDLKSELQRLQSTLNQRIQEKDADIVHRARELVARIKEDKLLHEKVWTQVQSLENTLR